MSDFVPMTREQLDAATAWMDGTPVAEVGRTALAYLDRAEKAEAALAEEKRRADEAENLRDQFEARALAAEKGEEKAEAALAKAPKLWECADCGFTFDAIHAFPGATYNCPSCETNKKFDKDTVVWCGDCAPSRIDRAAAAEWGQEIAMSANERLLAECERLEAALAEEKRRADRHERDSVAQGLMAVNEGYRADGWKRIALSLHDKETCLLCVEDSLDTVNNPPTCGVMLAANREALSTAPDRTKEAPDAPR